MAPFLIGLRLGRADEQCVSLPADVLHHHASDSGAASDQVPLQQQKRPAEQHAVVRLSVEESVGEEAVAVVYEVILALEHGHPALRLQAGHLALVAFEQLLDALVGGRLDDTPLFAVLPQQSALVWRIVDVAAGLSLKRVSMSQPKKARMSGSLTGRRKPRERGSSVE